MTAGEVRALLKSRRVLLQVADIHPDERAYLVRLDGVQVGTVAQVPGGWVYARPLPGGGLTVKGTWRNQRTAVRRLLRTY